MWEDLAQTFIQFQTEFRNLFPEPPRSHELWRTVFTHSSYTYEHPDQAPSYERLEFLGDAVLYAATSVLLYQRFPDDREDVLSFLRTTLIRKEILCKFAQEHRLTSWLRLGKAKRGLDAQGIVTIHADVAEAFMGAFYLEFGWEAFLRFIEVHLFRYLREFKEARQFFDPKSVLQEELARLKEQPPRYESLGRKDQVTWVRLLLLDQIFEGKGRNRKEAETDAARKALEFLKNSYGKT